MIDIIIPIYNAFDDMVACLDSVSQHTTKEARIILINDCSTDERIVQYLNQPEVTEREDIKVIQNKENIGFVGSVNLGMRMSTNDVILLNSDTIVTKGWIDKIRRCAASDPKIGTITPLSNNAEICSFPIPSQNNPLDDTDLDLVSETIEEMSLRLYPTLPTAVGFCMFIRRTMLNEIGLFDMETFGAGYGEENDLSMRACEAGYRNVLCDDTYIAHIGSSSFGAEKHVMVDRNTQRLLDRHPRYPHQVESYLLLDPLGPVRALPRFQLAIKQSTEPGTLTVLFNQSLESALELEGEIEKDSKAPHTHLLLITDTTCHLIFRHTSPNLGFKFGLETNESWSDFIFRLCKTFNIGEFHVGDEIDESHEFLNCFPESRSGLVSAITKATAATPFSKYRLYLAAQQNSYDYLLSASSYKLDVEQHIHALAKGLEEAQHLAITRLTELEEYHAALQQHDQVILNLAENKKALEAGLAQAEQLAFSRINEIDDLEKQKVPALEAALSQAETLLADKQKALEDLSLKYDQLTLSGRIKNKFRFGRNS